jgi:Fe-S cluster assembly protein SufB
MKKEIEISREIYDAANEENLLFRAQPGVTEELVRQISTDKKEPKWMLRKRLEALRLFHRLPMPNFGPDLSDLDFSEISFYMKPDSVTNSRTWDRIPEDIRKTYERLGIPKAERESLGGVGAQYESQTVYHKLKKDLEKQGVVFLDCDEGLKKYPDLFKKYFMTTCIAPDLHKFAALHGAVWSGGTFIYVPKNVKVKMPLQAYFRMNAKKGGQFEHTLIIADEGSEIHYIEGCFTKGNLVNTSQGYKKIEEMKKDDLVLSSEGKFKRVKEIQTRPYSGDIYNIEFYGDSTQRIEVTSDHPFLYVDRKSKNDRNKTFKPRWNIPKFFRKGDYLVMPIDNIRKHKKFREFLVEYRNKKEKMVVPMSPGFFRLIGYYLAEGSTIGEHYLCFDFHIKEREYIEDVKSLLKELFDVKAYEQPHRINNGVSVRVNSTKLARLFKEFGNRNYNKEVPSWAMQETNANQEDLIKGWFRGDGNYYNKKHSSGHKEIFRINTTSGKLVRQGRDILLRLGLVSFINKRDRSKENRRVMYTLGVTGEQMLKFSEIVGVKIKSKPYGKNRASMFGIDEKFAYFPIKRITKTKVENIPVFNLSVDDHETYTVSGLAVHNCSAPLYTENSLHAGCVEIHVLKGARVRYSSIENWSKNTYNLNTKRGIVAEEGVLEWVNGNSGSKCTMLYPCSVLVGEGAKTDYIGIAYAARGQHQDTGCKVYHLAPNTHSNVISKSISMDGGITNYRGLVKIKSGCKGSKSSVVCDGLMLDNKSRASTIPSMVVDEDDVKVSHEAAVGKIGEEQLFYLMSRGLSEQEATKLIVSGFIEPLIKELPLEYAVELNRLIELEIENSVC